MDRGAGFLPATNHRTGEETLRAESTRISHFKDQDRDATPLDYAVVYARRELIGY